MINQLISVVSRILFIGAFLLAALAIWEKLANLSGFTITLLGGYNPSQLLEFSVILLLFVIALQLREIKQISEQSLVTNGSD